MYVTVLVTISLTFLTLDLGVLGPLISKYCLLHAMSQSKGDLPVALKGDLIAEVALRGESIVEYAGLCGTRRLEKREEVGAEDG